MDKSKEKQKIVNSLSLDIDRLEKQRELVKDLEIKPVTMEEWQELCNTPLRYSDLLVEIAKATFPQGEDFLRECNCVKFKIGDIKIEIPTYNLEKAIINMHWYQLDYGEPEPISKYKNMRRYFDLLDNGNYTWYDLAKCRCNANLSKVRLFIWWFVKARWHKVNKAKWIERFEKENIYNQKRIDEYYASRKYISEKLEQLKEVLPIISEFSEVIGKIDNGAAYVWLNGEELMKLK